MTAYATLNKDISNLVADLDAHIIEHDLDHDCFNDPFHSMVSLGNVSAITSAVPGLADLFSELNLTVTSLGLHTVYYFETVSSWTKSFIVIPLRNFTGLSLNTHEINEGAVLRHSAYNIDFYELEDTTELENIPYEENTIYFINQGVYHSVRYDREPPTPLDLSGCGVLLLVAVEEDLSAYFE